MATFTLNLEIDSTIMSKKPGDNLNIAKKVNGVYTTTFSGASINPIGTQQQLLEVNRFRWTEAYAALLSMSFEHGMQVSAATKPKELQFGQQTNYDLSTKMLSNPDTATDFAGGGTAKDSFVLGSVPDNLRACVSCKAGPGSNKWLVIYVDNESHTGVMNKTLTPINKYSLFWDSKIITESMIDYSKTVKPYEFEFPPGKKEMTLRWGYATPDAPSNANEQPKWNME